MTSGLVQNRSAATGAADPRFRTLLGDAAWSRLPAAVQRRFAKRLAGATVVYVGEVVEVEASIAGQALAAAARLIGGPLPRVFETPSPSVVTVTQDGAGNQVWTRLYARRLGFPQVIHSTKRFAGPTGLEEHVGRGVGMALKVGVEGGALLFESVFFFLAVGERRFRLPRLLSPGRIVVRHAEVGDGRFSFTLDVTHPVFGRLLRQHALFREEAP